MTMITLLSLSTHLCRAAILDRGEIYFLLKLQQMINCLLSKPQLNHQINQSPVRHENTSAPSPTNRNSMSTILLELLTPFWPNFRGGFLGSTFNVRKPLVEDNLRWKLYASISVPSIYISRLQLFLTMIVRKIKNMMQFKINYHKLLFSNCLSNSAECLSCCA